MATISRTGIAGGSTISPTHITNIIDALDGSSSTTTVVASGSFSGSLTGNATSATSASYATTASYVANASSFPFAGSAIISGSLIVTGSLNVTAGITGSLFGTASYATTASYALNAGGGASFPYTGSAIISGSLLVTGSLNVSGSARVFGTTILTGSIGVKQTAGIDSFTGKIVGHPNLNLDLTDVGKTPSTGQFVIPTFTPAPGGGVPAAGAMYWDDASSVLYIYQATGGGAWRSVSLT